MVVATERGRDAVSTRPHDTERSLSMQPQFTTPPLPVDTSRVMVPLVARIMRRTKHNGTCWEWQGAKSPKGYGVIGRGRGGAGNVLVHRAVWEIINGPVPNGVCVLHACDNPPCCNPEHLYLGDRAENNQHMFEAGRARPHGQVPGAKRPCALSGCSRQSRSRNLCKKHYSQWRRESQKGEVCFA